MKLLKNLEIMSKHSLLSKKTTTITTKRINRFWLNFWGKELISFPISRYVSASNFDFFILKIP